MVLIYQNIGGFMSFQEVGFIGLGLIGGSVALKLKEIYQKPQ